MGLPLTLVDHQLIELVGLEAILAVLAVVSAIGVSRTVVRRCLRPLNRVAATAQQVSQLPLDRGEVALAVRVPPADADPTSEVGRVGQAFNHMLNNVEDALAARQASETKVRQFVADASHELRNPLAAIRGYAELTRRERDSMSANAAFAMGRVEAEAERMSYLVEDLLLLARLDSGPNIDVAPVDLSEVVINAVSDARAAGPEHVWQLDLPPEPVVALGDRYRLHQVVANLLANARTHTPPGTRVGASVAVRGSDAVITVTDSGPGIPEDIRSRVFERFTRAEVSRVRTPGRPPVAAPASGSRSSPPWWRPTTGRSACRASRAAPSSSCPCRWPRPRASRPAGPPPTSPDRAAPGSAQALQLLLLEHGLGLARRELGAVELGVATTQCEQLRVPTALDDPAVLEDDDLVGRADGGEPVRDDERRTPLERLAERGGDRRLGGRVERGGRLVEDDHAGVGQQQPGDGEPLPLAAGEPVAALADDGVEPAGQARDQGASRARRSADHSSSSVASTLASSRLDRMESWNRWPSWVTMPEVERSASKLRSRTSTPPSRTAPASTS